MRKIKIFIGSSIVEFKNERQELENFIHTLSNDFIDKYEIMIIPFTCEAADNAMAITRKQDEYNQQIAESEMCFFLFYTRAGEYTKEELNYAYNAYKNSEQKKPKVYVYFKMVPEDVKTDESIEDLKQILEKQYGHFFSTFESLDTVKLRILLNLKFQEMNFIQVGMDAGQLQVNGNPIKDVDVSKVMEFSNNEELGKLEKELQEIEPKYLKMRPEYAKGGCSDDFYREYAELASRRSSLIEQIEDLKKQIFELSLSLSRDDANGDMTPRMREAYRLLEQGDTKGCLAVLDEKDLNGDYFARKKARQEKERRLKEEAKREARLFIRQHKLAIDTLMTMYDYAGRFEEIERRYEVIVEEAEEEEVEIGVIIDYANYLRDHGASSKATKLFLSAIEMCEESLNTDPLLYYPFLAKSNNGLALLYANTQNSGRAEEYYKKALEIREKLVSDNKTEEYESSLASSYNNLANLYYDTQHSDKAEEFFKKAIEINERLVENNNSNLEYKSDLAGNYNNLANMYADSQRTSESERYYKQAIEINELLSKENPNEYESHYADNLNNLAILYSETQHSMEAEKCHLKALSLRKNLSNKDPLLYEPQLASSYSNIACLYSETQQYEEAKKNMLEAISIRERLAEYDAKLYLPGLADCYNNLAIIVIESETDGIKEAEKYFKDSTEIREQLANDDPDMYNPQLAASYNNLANLYSNEKNFKDAEMYYLHAIKIRERLAEKDPAMYESDLANSFHNLANLYSDNNHSEEAEKYYYRAIEINEQLAKTNSCKVNPFLVQNYNALAILYSDNQRFDDSVKFRFKEIKIREELAKVDPVMFEFPLSASYYYTGLFYENNQQINRAEEYYQKSISVLERLVVKDEKNYEPNLVQVLKKLKQLYTYKNQLDKASEYSKKVQRIKEKYEQLANNDLEQYGSILERIQKNLSD